MLHVVAHDIDDALREFLGALPFFRPPERAKRRLDQGFIDELTPSIDDAVRKLESYPKSGITRSIGLIANMFTAVLFTRMIFDFMLGRGKVEQLSI